MREGWRPEYSERYYTVNTTMVDRLLDKENLYLAINRFMWLDIDDDYKALDDGLVFQTKEEALNKAIELFDKIQ